MASAMSHAARPICSNRVIGTNRAKIPQTIARSFGGRAKIGRFPSEPGRNFPPDLILCPVENNGGMTMEHHQWNQPLRRSLVIMIVLGVAALITTGCGGGKQRVNGVTYPQVGVASWYGKKFHGRRTASGERYNMRAMTAAHRSLPFGSRVRVTDVETGRSVKVRINDRGPYYRRRVIDLSYGAAKKLGMVQKGITRVRVEVLNAPIAYRRAPNLEPAPPKPFMVLDDFAMEPAMLDMPPLLIEG